MPLHECSHTFEELAANVLPAHMTKMRNALVKPGAMNTFAKPGVGPGALLKELGIAQDFSGCYVLLEDEKPIYVGISRKVIGRLRQHVFGKTHFDASLAFRIAKDRHPDMNIKNLTRCEAMKDSSFGISFTAAQDYLRSLHVAFICIENPLELYVFEAYCALELDTNQWNSFETH